VSQVVSIDTGANTIVVEDAVFSNGDYVVVSSAIYNTSGFSNVQLQISSVGSSVSGGTQYSYTVSSGDETDIDKGDSVTRASGDLVYINATEGAGSPRIAGYNNVTDFTDSPIDGNTASPVWELEPTGGKIGSLLFDGSELRNEDDTFSLSNTGLKLTSDTSYSSPDINQEIRWNSGGYRIGYSAFEGTGYLSASSLNLFGTFDGVTITGNDGVNDGVLRVRGGIHLEANSGYVTVSDLPTSAPGTANTLWNDSGTIKITAAPASAPSTPTGLTLEKSRASSAMRVSWDTTTDADSYDLQRSTDDATWSTVATDTTSTQYFDSTPFSNKATTYYYRVRATNTSGDSAYSASVNDTYNAATNYDSLTPSNVTFIFGGLGSDTLDWDEPDAGSPTSYSIQYAIDTGAGFGSWNSLNASYTGVAPYTFDACSLASNTDDIKLRISATYSNPSETSLNIESNTETVSGCI